MSIVIGSPWLLTGGSLVTTIVNGLLGAAIIALSLREGPIDYTYGRPLKHTTFDATKS